MHEGLFQREWTGFFVVSFSVKKQQEKQDMGHAKRIMGWWWARDGSGRESLLLIQSTWVRFPASTGHLNVQFQGSDIL